MNLTLAEYLNMAQPFYAEGAESADFLIRLFGLAVKDEVSDICSALDLSRDFVGRLCTGKKSMPASSAGFITSNLDEKKIKKFFREHTTDAAVRILAPQIREKLGIACKDSIPSVSNACAEGFINILVECATKQKKVEKSVPDNISDTLQTIESLIGMLPKPPVQEPPDTPREDEKAYISELCLAYAEHEKKEITEGSIASYPVYAEDLKQRRIDYFAAEAVNRGLQELKSKHLGGQFDVLKDEMLTGVRGISQRKYDDGYERMLEVMDRAVIVPLSQYILSQSPYWISNHIRMGVCHYLVNDQKLRWVASK